MRKKITTIVLCLIIVALLVCCVFLLVKINEKSNIMVGTWEKFEEGDFLLTGTHRQLYIDRDENCTIEFRNDGTYVLTTADGREYTDMYSFEFDPEEVFQPLCIAYAGQINTFDCQYLGILIALHGEDTTTLFVNKRH